MQRIVVTFSALLMTIKCFLFHSKIRSFLFTILPSPVLLTKRSFEKSQQIFVHDQLEIVDGCRVPSCVTNSDNADKKFAEKSLKKQIVVLKRRPLKPIFP